MNARHWLYTGGAALGLAALLAWAFAPRPIAVETAGVATGRFETAVEDEGKTRLIDHYVVSAPLAGQVSRIALREGDLVAAGATVALLRPARAPLTDERTRRQQQAQLEAAHARVEAATAALERADLALAKARHDHRRAAQLGQAGYVAPSRLESEELALQAAQREVDSAGAQRRIARHEVEQAHAALEAGLDAERVPDFVFPVRAPVQGRVLRVNQPSESVVALGTPLVELGDPERIEVMAEMLTADAVHVRPGAEARIDRWGGAPLAGKVRRIEPAAFTKISALGVEEQRVRVLIDVARPAGNGERPGIAYRVGVRILTARHEGVRKIPVSAVFPLPGAGGREADRMGVYLVRDGRAVLTAVELGGRNEAEAWVRNGLPAQARVVLYPPSSLRDGARVSPRDVAQAR